MKLVKMRRNGERFWINPIETLADGSILAVVWNKLLTMPFKQGDRISVTPEELLNEEMEFSPVEVVK